MPGTTIIPVPHYVPAPPTKADLEYANLAIVDLSKINDAQGLAELVEQVRKAMTTEGFFYVINHGYTQAQTERCFDIADVPCAHVPENEKPAYAASIKETGSYQGYKPRQYWHIDGGIRDQTESYCINRDVNKREHPKALRPYLPDLDAFARHNHFNILYPILRIFALGMELPEDTFIKTHEYSDVGESYIRFMKYFPRSEDEEIKTEQVWLKGHTDIGSVTILWSQPVAALQVLQSDGKWRWVRHIENALVVNAGDTMEFLSGGYYKATIHRVVQPPEDQRGYTRLGLYYFALPSDDVKLVPVSDSPVLKKNGIQRHIEDADAPTSVAWRKGRTAAYGTTQLKPGKERNIEEEIIEGVVVKHYR